MASAKRLAWSVAKAFMGYRMITLMPGSPACRRQWSRMGYKKHSVLPEPVPVVTSVASGVCPSRELSRWNARSWCA
jgi:hypothetical protein